jgi:hypothetical protein
MLPKSWNEGPVRLRWSVSRAGYEIRAPKPLDRSRSIAAALLDNYEGPKSPDLVAVGSAFDTKVLTLGRREALGELMSMEETPEGALAFSGKWGLLTPGRSDPLDELYDTKRQLCRAHQIGRTRGLQQLAQALKTFEPRWGDPEAPVLGRAEIQIILRGGAIHWYVQTLRVFLWLDLLLDVGGAAELAQCGRCKKWHARRPKGRAPEYCSDACRVAAWRRAHKGARNRKR